MSEVTGVGIQLGTSKLVLRQLKDYSLPSPASFGIKYIVVMELLRPVRNAHLPKSPDKVPAPCDVNTTGRLTPAVPNIGKES